MKETLTYVGVVVVVVDQSSMPMLTVVYNYLFE